MTIASKRRWSYSLRTMAFMFVGLALVFGYSASYYRLSRRGLDEVQIQGWGLNVFLYVPWSEFEADKDFTKHHRLARFYAPANFVDHNLFGGPSPIRGMILDLE